MILSVIGLWAKMFAAAVNANSKLLLFLNVIKSRVIWLQMYDKRANVEDRHLLNIQ